MAIVRLVKEAAKAATKKSSSSVKKVPRNTAPKTRLENRGARPTAAERKERAQERLFDKAEKNYDALSEMRYTGLRSYPKGFDKSVARGPGKKNTRKLEALKKEANKKVPVKVTSTNKESPKKPTIKINSKNLSSSQQYKTKQLKLAEKRALKTANKKNKRK
jgi:predicted aminopeptidase